MRRVLITTLALLGAGPAVVQAAPRHPRAELTHYACREAQNPKHREMAVTAIMRHIQGTEHMAIKFELLREAAGAQSFSEVRTGDLDKWINPKDPTLGQRLGDVWKLAKVISDLGGPAVYRLKVDFRWTGAHAHLLAQTHRNTPVCRAD